MWLWHALGAFLMALGGIAFFFAIIGVFGTTAALGALLLFIVAALLIMRRSRRP